MDDKKEKLIEQYSYYFNSSLSFVEEYFDNFKEMDYILKMIFKSIKKDKNTQDYDVKYDEYAIMIKNKKTKERYKISIEF